MAMSWDLVVFDLDDPLSDPETGEAVFPDGWEPPNIWTLPQLRAEISEALPDVDWSEKNWGHLTGSGFSLEFNIGNEDTTSNFMIHARGNATQSVVRLMSVTGWRILDTVTGKWMHEISNPDEGREKFQGFLDKLLESQNPTKRPNLLKRIFKR